jgi:8-oxo-dGTP diphosphatase
MKPNAYIHTLVRGLIVVDGHVLIAHCKGAANTFLPGGHVALQEGLRAGLGRELAEEFGAVGEVGRYLGAVEHQWGEGERTQHEINHVFEASLPHIEGLQPPISHEAHLEFSWVAVADLTNHNLKPMPIIDLVRRFVEGGSNPFFGSTFAGS